MASATTIEMDKLFREGNLEGLKALVDGYEDLQVAETSRAAKLLGDLLLASGEFKAALDSYDRSHAVLPEGNFSAVFQSAVCSRKLNDLSKFRQTARMYLEAQVREAKPLSRLLLLAAEMQDRDTYDRIRTAWDLSGTPCEDIGSWQRTVRAMVAMGDLEDAAKLAKTAKELPTVTGDMRGFFSGVIAKAGTKRAEELFKAKDLGGLRGIFNEIEDLNTVHARRVGQLLGNLLLNSGHTEEALVKYKISENALPTGNPAAMFGAAVCYRKLGDSENFARVVSKFIDVADYNEDSLSRLLLHAAEIVDQKSFERVAAALDLEGSGCQKPRIWHRAAKARVVMGDREGAAPLARRARELAADDPDLLLLIAELDYDINEYWEKRYNSSQGERTPLMVSQQSDDVYNEVTVRDEKFLRATLRPVRFDLRRLAATLGLGKPFKKVVDCGCGSGRLVGYLATKSETLSCFDISQTAVNFARENNAGVSNVSFEVANLANRALPVASFDLVFDFTAVQHVADRDQWRSVLKNYVNACAEGGTIYLFEAIGDDQRRDVLHQTNASPETYIKTMEEFGARFVRRIDASWPDHCALVFTK